MKVNKIPEDIGEYLRYEDGKLYWVKKSGLRCEIEREAGCINVSTNYKMVRFRKIAYRAHRIVWFLVNKTQPPEILDHINNDRLDNRIENLRESDHSKNQYNTKKQKNNTSGIKGVSWHNKLGKYTAYIIKDGKQKHIGVYTDIKEAEKAIKQARQQLHGEYANHG